MKIPITSFIRGSSGVLTSPTMRTEFAYSDGADKENYILATLLAARDCSIFSQELRRGIRDWASEYHFSQERHNLLRHITLRPDMHVLELGCGCGAITRQLGESGARVTAVEGSLQRARAAAARCRDLDNVSVYCSNFQDIEFPQKYDVITLIGVLEYSPQYFNSKHPVRECLAIAMDALRPHGVLIVAIENQLGLKYLCGLHEDHADIRYFGIEDRYGLGTAITFGRRELQDALHEAGLPHVVFQYPFPDYKIPKAVLTEMAFEDGTFQPQEILRQIPSRDYSGALKPAFDERLAIPVLCRNGLMRDLSHSFLVLASPDPGGIAGLFDPGLLAAVYTTDRADAYNIRTSFIAAGEAIVVKKQRLAPGAPPLAAKDVLLHHPGDETYIAGKILESEYKKSVALRDFDALDRLFSMQVDFLLKEAVIAANADNPAAAEIKPEYFDCVPSNMIIHGDRIEYVDREWTLNRPMKLGSLLLRTVDVLHALGGGCPELGRDRLIARLGRLGLEITPEILDEYDTLITDVLDQVYRDPALDSET